MTVKHSLAMAASSNAAPICASSRRRLLWAAKETQRCGVGPRRSSASRLASRLMQTRVFSAAKASREMPAPLRHIESRDW